MTTATSGDGLLIDGLGLGVDDVVRAARGQAGPVSLAESAVMRVTRSRDLKHKLVETGQPIYGVTTGFGDSVRRQIGVAKTAELQRNIARYHLNGTGPISAPDVVRATILVRANCLARGNSGVRPLIISRLLDYLNFDVLPLIPERGSVGASGDLVPLCYLASAVFGEGNVRHGGQVQPVTDVLRALRLDPVEPEAKDGLALVNGTSFSAAIAAVAVAEAERVALLAELCTALTSEALRGNRGHFDPFIHAQKPHPGQLTAAQTIAGFLADSRLALHHGQVVDLADRIGDRGYVELSRSIQDRYSVRCAPHITGMLRDTIEWVRTWLDVEINSSSDNPLFDAAGAAVHNGGNFYGGHVAQAMDSLKTAVANIADLIDRQLELIVDEKFNEGLTPNLIPWFDADDHHAGLNHGFKGMQLACSAIAAEALKGTVPASVFSRSTEAHNQDKVSMSPIAARDARAVIALTEEAIAIHLLALCQALDLRGLGEASTTAREIHGLIRQRADFVGSDRAMDSDIAAVLSMIRTDTITAAVQRLATGGAPAARLPADAPA